MHCERCTKSDEGVREYEVSKPGSVVRRVLCESCRDASKQFFKVKLSKEQPEPPAAPEPEQAPAAASEAEAGTEATGGKE